MPSQDKTYSVYQHLNKVNGKSYIGMTGRNPISRWGTNDTNYISSPHFYAAIQQYGWNSFEHIVLAEKHEMKPVYCPETDTTYKSIQDCARQLGINATSVCAVCRGKHHTHHGYHFHYAEEVGCINA